jgi:inorganic pyrophosphatase
MSNSVEVYIEIEKHSNYKYEYNKETNALELDRILPYPYFYPYAYGYIPNTLAMDGDDLDILIISDRDNIKKDTFYKVFIVGVLIMEDEKGMDEKVLCVLDEDREKIKDIS